jgi:hypothetical protein
MSQPSSSLPARPSLEQLRKQAKDLMRALRGGDRAAAERFHAVVPHRADSAAASLADAQFVVAREYGFANWSDLARYVEAASLPGLRRFEALAQAVADAYTSASYDAIRTINWTYGTSFVWYREPETMQRRLPTWFASGTRHKDLAVSDAQHLVARMSGFDSWEELIRSIGPSTGTSSVNRVPPPAPHYYRVNEDENTIQVRGVLAERHWDVVLGVIKERGLTGLMAGGITDGVVNRISRLNQLERLRLGHSGELTDDGLRHLSRLARLQELDLGGPASAITDRGLDVLRDLRDLRRVSMVWAPRISDTGVRNLAACDRLESVDLMGTWTGDGAIEALLGKPNLRLFATGRLVTDDGLALFHRFPRFKTWHGGEMSCSLMSFGAEPTNLLADGPFTDRGLASLAGLEGLTGLNLFWHSTGFTDDGLKGLAELPYLGFVRCAGDRCTDEGLRHIGAIPGLRMLLSDGVVATDAGFRALSDSKTIEYICAGGETPNLTGRGFAAMAALPALRGLAISCQHLDDAALSTLPSFPALKALLPSHIGDGGFRYIGRCEQLEELWCMHCRETTDVATEHISGLTRLKSYYAGMTGITDRSLEILARISSLERLEFWEIASITDAGVRALAQLPRLREISIGGSPHVTRASLAMFPAGVRITCEP